MKKSHQADLLSPREGWECDTSNAAPIVYRDNKILARRDFDREFDDLLNQADTLRQYADWLVDSVPSLVRELNRMARKRGGGQVIVSFFSLLPRLPEVDVVEFAAKQLPVVKNFITKTSGNSGLKKFHKHYQEYATELERVLQQ